MWWHLPSGKAGPERTGTVSWGTGFSLREPGWGGKASWLPGEVMNYRAQRRGLGGGWAFP